MGLLIGTPDTAKQINQAWQIENDQASDNRKPDKQLVGPALRLARSAIDLHWKIDAHIISAHSIALPP
jgi:hypothetical protein